MLLLLLPLAPLSQFPFFFPFFSGYFLVNLLLFLPPFALLFSGHPPPLGPVRWPTSPDLLPSRSSLAAAAAPSFSCIIFFSLGPSGPAAPAGPSGPANFYPTPRPPSAS